MVAARNYNGFALLEIMISLSLGLLLLSGVYEVFSSIRQSSRYIQGLALIQENGQLASYFLIQDISQSGYTGCRKINAEFPVSSHIEAKIQPELIVHGYNQQTLPSEEKTLAKKMVAGSSVVSVQFTHSQTANVVNPVKKAASSLTIDNSTFFKSGDDIMVADCLHADLVSITSVNTDNSLRLNAEISEYPAGSQVGLWENESFYVGKTGRFDNRKQEITALYVYQPNGRDEELVDNVTNMHVQYAYLNTAQQLVFVPASQITDWTSIKAVRIILLLNSGDSILTERQSLSFDNQTWQAADHKLYRQWEAIVSLPNR